MKIVNLQIDECTQPLKDPSWKFARATVPQLSAHVITLTDEEGNQGLGYSHAIPAISTHGGGSRASLEWLASLIVGRTVNDIGELLEEIDAALAHSYSVKAAIDMALHDLKAQRLGIPVSGLLGGALHTRIPLSRILAIKSPNEMAEKAAQLREQGYRQLKLKLSGDTDLDLTRIAAVRNAVGAATTLTLDPNQSYTAKQMSRAFSRMEKYDIALIEQPVPAGDLAGLALLTRTLPVAIEADESAQTVADVFRLASERMVDVVNVKITKFGGFRRYQEVVHICEAAGIGCRVGAAFGPALLQGFGAHAASIIKKLEFACELSEHLHLDADPFTALDIQDGTLTIPTGTGCGVTWAHQAP